MTVTIPRVVAVGLVASILIVTLYISLLGCTTGAVEVEGDLFSSGYCVTVTDGVVRTEAPGL